MNLLPFEQRNPQSKFTSLSFFTSYQDLAAKQFRQLATDGQSQAGSTKLATCRSIGLLEGFKDGLLFITWNPNAGILYSKIHYFIRHGDVQINRALLRKLQCI